MILLRFVLLSSMIVLISVEASGSGEGTSNSFRNEKVKSASFVTRPMTDSDFGGPTPKWGFTVPGMDKHHGVKVTTTKGNEYLIHHPGANQLTTVTSASNMSGAWKKERDISVKGDKTVQAVFSGANGRSTNPIVNYVTAGGRKGAALGAEKALKD